MQMAIQLDHLILAVNDRKKSVEFYTGRSLTVDPSQAMVILQMLGAKVG